jgi:hypothetical protein
LIPGQLLQNSRVRQAPCLLLRLSLKEFLFVAGQTRSLYFAMPDMDIEHLSPGLEQPWPAHFISVCARRARNSMSSTERRRQSRSPCSAGTCATWPCGAAGVPIMGRARDSSPAVASLIYAREGLCWRLKCQAERVLEILLDFGAAGEASSERKS